MCLCFRLPVKCGLLNPVIDFPIFPIMEEMYLQKLFRFIMELCSSNTTIGKTDCSLALEVPGIPAYLSYTLHFSFLICPYLDEAMYNWVWDNQSGSQRGETIFKKEFGGINFKPKLKHITGWEDEIHFLDVSFLVLLYKTIDSVWVKIKRSFAQYQRLEVQYQGETSLISPNTDSKTHR